MADFHRAFHARIQNILTGKASVRIHFRTKNKTPNLEIKTKGFFFDTYIETEFADGNDTSTKTPRVSVFTRDWTDKPELFDECEVFDSESDDTDYGSSKVYTIKNRKPDDVGLTVFYLKNIK